MLSTDWRSCTIQNPLLFGQANPVPSKSRSVKKADSFLVLVLSNQKYPFPSWFSVLTRYVFVQEMRLCLLCASYAVKCCQCEQAFRCEDTINLVCLINYKIKNMISSN